MTEDPETAKDPETATRSRRREPPRFKRKLRTITLKELRTDPEEVARRIRGNEVLIVYKRSRPLFRLIKPYEDGSRVFTDLED